MAKAWHNIAWNRIRERGTWAKYNQVIRYGEGHIKAIYQEKAMGDLYFRIVNASDAIARFNFAQRVTKGISVLQSNH